MIYWILLLLAGLFEVAWAVGLKYSQGFQLFWPSFWTVLCLTVSMALLGIAARSIPIGTAYAVWVGIGVVGTAIVGVFYYGEEMSVSRFLFLSLLVFSIIGLKFTHHQIHSGM